MSYLYILDKKVAILLILVIVLMLFFLMFSPFSLLILSLICLVLFSPYLHSKILRYTFLFFSFVGLIFSSSSKGFYDEKNNDLIFYYGTFLDLKNSLTDGLFDYGGGLEIGWSLLYWFLGNFITVSEIGLVILNSSIVLFFIILWCELKIVTKVNRGEIGIFYFFLFLFMNFSILGYLERQSLALVFLLFAFTSKKMKNFLLLVFIASLFHLSSILIGLIIFIVKKYNIKFKYIVTFTAFLILVRFLFIPIVDYFIKYISFVALSSKINFFTDIEFSVSSFRILFLQFFMLCIILISDLKNKENKEIYFYALLAIISNYVFIGIPLLADRIFILFIVLFGFFYYFLVFKRFKKIGLLFSLLYFIYFFLERSGFLGQLPAQDYYWLRYNLFESSPFYYLVF